MTVRNLPRSKNGFLRDMRSKPASAYRLPIDGRKWKVLCRDRKMLADFLASYGDRDGSRIFPSIRTILAAFDTFSRATLFRRLDDLRLLGYLQSEGLKGERGPRIRRLRPEKIIKRPEAIEIDLAEVSDSH